MCPANQEEPILPLRLTHRLYLGEDDDAAGFAYLPTYFHWMSVGDQELFAQLGHPMWALLDSGSMAPVVRAECDYVGFARTGDRVTHEIQLSLGSGSSSRTSHVFSIEGRGRIAEGVVVRCWVSRASLQKIAVPEWLRAAGNR